MQRYFEELDEIYKSYGNKMLTQPEVDEIIVRLSLGNISNVKTVLIVDDAAFIRKVERQVLTENGYLVIAEADNGQTAIMKYKEFRPDLVIMNITMPVMDGIEATKLIRNFDSNAKVVMFSGISNYQTIKDSILAGATDFIVEKFEMNRVITALKAFDTEKTEAPTSPLESKFPKLQEKETTFPDSMWPESFKLKDIKSPKSIIEEQAALLVKITANSAIALLIATKKDIDTSDFKYDFRITSPKLSNYNFLVFIITYDIDVYPCKIYLDEQIAEELKIDREISLNTYTELEKLLAKILRSNRISYIVSNLMSIA